MRYKELQKEQNRRATEMKRKATVEKEQQVEKQREEQVKTAARVRLRGQNNVPISPFIARQQSARQSVIQRQPSISPTQQSVIQRQASISPTQQSGARPVNQRQQQALVVHQGTGMGKRAEENWRSVLGIVNTNSSDAALKKYRALQRQTHPNRGGSVNAFNRVQRAWARYQEERQGQQGQGVNPSRSVSRTNSMIVPNMNARQALTVYRYYENRFPPGTEARQQLERDMSAWRAQNLKRSKSNATSNKSGISGISSRGTPKQIAELRKFSTGSDI